MFENDRSISDGCREAAMHYDRDPLRRSEQFPVTGELITAYRDAWEQAATHVQNAKVDKSFAPLVFDLSAATLRAIAALEQQR